MDDGALQIRSYRVVFDLERRIHRIDRFRVPLPYGLPLRSVAYALAALAAIAALERLPALGPALRTVPAPARLVLLPVGISCALTRLRVDGRSAHAAVGCWLRHAAASRHVVAFDRRAATPRLWMTDLVTAPDASGPRWRRGTVMGPADLAPSRPVKQRRRGRRVELTPAEAADGVSELIHVEAGGRAVLR
jgi:hypothetical protein